MQGSDPSSGEREIGKTELFLGFLKIGMLGFGGVAPIARHVIVEERRWLSESEFAAVLGVGQILPGPNTMNAAVIIGDRFQGAVGAALCVIGQMLVPLILVTTLGALYAEYAGIPLVNAIVLGAAAGAAGLITGIGIKMARKIKLKPVSFLVAAATFAAVGIMQWPLVPVVLVMVPVSIGIAMLQRRA